MKVGANVFCLKFSFLIFYPYDMHHKSSCFQIFQLKHDKFGIFQKLTLQSRSEDSQKSTFSNRNFNHVNKFTIHEKRNISNFWITGLSEEFQRINF